MKKIEVIFPEICDLYGEQSNIKYLARSCSGTEIINTHLGEKPKFIDDKVNLVYMGTMTERSQLLAIENLLPYSDEIKGTIEKGQNFLVTGNALEIFGKEIVDTDEMPFHSDSVLVNTTEKRTKCLGIFDTTAIRTMSNRINSLYLGEYQDIKVVGFKSIFAYSEYSSDIAPLFHTLKGHGFNLKNSFEGIEYRNFRATYLIGPLLILNPYFMIKLADKCGLGKIIPYQNDAAVQAYEARLREYSEPGRGFYY